MSGTYAGVLIPKIELYGLGDTNGQKSPHVFAGGEVKMAAFGLETPACDLYRDAMPLGELTALFNAYLHTKIENHEIPADITQLLTGLFEMKTAAATRNACEYIGLTALRGDDVPVVWTVNPKDYVLNTADKRALEPYWEVVAGDESEQFPSFLPGPGWVELTNDGAFMPESGSALRPRGVPFSTVRDKEAAIRSWTDAGFTKQLAEKAASYIWTRDDGRRGAYSVSILLNHPVSGTYAIDITKKPDQEVVF